MSYPQTYSELRAYENTHVRSKQDLERQLTTGADFSGELIAWLHSVPFHDEEYCLSLEHSDHAPVRVEPVWDEFVANVHSDAEALTKKELVDRINGICPEVMPKEREKKFVLQTLLKRLLNEMLDLEGGRISYIMYG